MEIKDIIKIHRVKCNLTQKELGEMVGVSEATVCRWESGAIASLKQNKIKALAKALNISEAELIPGAKVDDVPGYYTDGDTAILAQQLHDDPNLRVLMDASRKLKPEELQAVIALVKTMKGIE